MKKKIKSFEIAIIQQNFVIYESRISWKLIETFETIIDITKQDRRLKCCYKTSTI